MDRQTRRQVGLPRDGSTTENHRLRRPAPIAGRARLPPTTWSNLPIMDNLLVQEDPTVFVVGTDPTLGRAIKDMSGGTSLRVDWNASTSDFFDSCDPAQPGCLVWELPRPVADGLELFDHLQRRRIHLPVIIIAEAADTPTVVLAMKAGAQNFLNRPVSLGRLREAIGEALLWDAENRRRLVLVDKIERRLARLTSGEAEVLRMMLNGDSNRQIADALRLSIRTIEVRRAKLMKKMRAKSLAELVRLVLTVAAGDEHRISATEARQTSATASRRPPR